MNKKYIIDSNIFITAHRQIYPFDIAPGFWEQIIKKGANQIIIIEPVNDEIAKGKDILTDWYLENKDQFEQLKIPDQIVLESYKDIINHLNTNDQYKQSAKYEFASIADSWLCAYGLAYDYTIVTLEKYQEGAKKRILIPNICKEFDINYIDLLQFMRQLSFKL